VTHQRKPAWLKVRYPSGPEYVRIDRYHREQGLHSVCRSAACPNQGECWTRGTATFMILGNHCTRDCHFCNVSPGTPPSPDPLETDKVACAIAELELRHAVITSVTRDDLDDGGASAFAAVTTAIRTRSPRCTIELLIPDLQGNHEALETILAAEPDILGHNLETVPRLYTSIRCGAEYRRSLALLDAAGRQGARTKSGLMLGLGENDAELLEVLHDLRGAGVGMLTLGQYLAPSRRHAPVARYVTPEAFAELETTARGLGFTSVAAGPLVRSSYYADRQESRGSLD